MQVFVINVVSTLEISDVPLCCLVCQKEKTRMLAQLNGENVLIVNPELSLAHLMNSTIADWSNKFEIFVLILFFFFSTNYNYYY